MRVAVFGGTGYIGSELIPRLTTSGHDVLLFARPKPGRVASGAPSRVELVDFDARAGGPWKRALEGTDAVVNMAGATIGARWTAERRRLIRSSRVDLTEMLVDAIAKLDRRPSVLVNASGAGYYGDRGDDLLTEDEPPGTDWLGRLAADWEAAAARAEEFGLRVACLRTGIVLGAGSETLRMLALPFRLFAGGPVGLGRQWFPWIHLTDMAELYRFAVENEAASGPVNAVAGAVRERDLARTLGRLLGRPSWLPAPVFAIRLLYLGFADALAASQRVVPQVAERLGFRFRHPELEEALTQALSGDRDPIQAAA